MSLGWLTSVAFDVSDPWSADCWMKGREIAGDVVIERFVLSTVLGSTTEPEQSEKLIPCALYYNRAISSRRGLVYLGDEPLEGGARQVLVDAALESGFTVCAVGDESSPKPAKDEILTRSRDDFMRLKRVLGYMLLRTDRMDPDAINLWAQGSRCGGALAAFVQDRSWRQLVLEAPEQELIPHSEFERLAELTPDRKIQVVSEPSYAATIREIARGGSR